MFCVALTAATLAPVLENWRERPADGFPFSYYPMFSRPVGKTYRVTHAVGIAGDGREHVIPFRYLGSGGMNEVRNRVQRAAREDPHGFCSEVAAALRAHAADELGGIREVVVVTGAYLMQAFYEGRIEARSKREHARCRVAR